MQGTASISGIISGLQTHDIIAKMMELERMPIVRLQARQSALQAKSAAWQEVNMRILAVKVKADVLSLRATFDAKNFTSSDEAIITGSASFTAQAGTYYLNVNSVARTHQIKSDGFAETTSSIGTGSVSISVGSGSPTEIAITDTNSTLAGLRDAINRSDAGVTATIINDGTADAPYRLLITSKTSGTSGEISIESDLAGGPAPSFTTMQTAQDASITMGEGDGAITVTKNTNTITDLIPGVNLNLRQADAGKTVTLTVQHDVSATKTAIQEFVEQYNNLNQFINGQFKYDVTTKAVGTLFADSNLQAIQSELRNRTSNPIVGLNQSIIMLSQIGISRSNNDNRLTINENELNAALANNLSSVRSLFLAIGEATSPNVSYVASSENTKPSGELGYAIDITAVATQSRVTAGTSQPAALDADETLTINGKIVQLTAGMTAEQVVAKINEYSSQTGVTASKTGIDGEGTGDYLTLTRVQYGSKQTMTAVSSLSGAGPNNTSGLGNVQVTESEAGGESGNGTGAAGTDVAGTINGEAATGHGQILIGNEGNANTEGLRLRITGTTTGDYGTIHFTQGIASQVGHYLDVASRPGSGIVRSAQEAIQSQITRFDADIAVYEDRLGARELRLIRQFAAMESALSRLQGQGAFLSSQIDQLSNNWIRY